ncbi:MAG: choice-of-anchor D domain-containing protein [Candidatus Methylacidiphilales bacterium]|nr:choice-of-anchor D domain-containing protein [Candidatus Methylacidiphilales bacterium]
MKNWLHSLPLALLALGFGFGTAQAQTSFTPGNLIVNRVGNGTALTSSATPVALLEYTPSGTLQQTVTIPSTGSNQQTEAGTSTANGYLNTNGTLLAVPGYNQTEGTTAIPNTNTKVVQIFGSNASVASRVVFPTSGTIPFSGAAIRSAVPVTSNTFYATGGGSGVWYYDGTNFVNTSTTATNLRVVKIFNGNLYFSTGAGTRGIYKVGSGLPTGSGVTSATVFETGATSSPYGFSVSADGNTIYVADDSTIASGGGIQKWTFNGSVWSKTYTLGTGTGSTVGVRGLTVDYSGANPIIYATTTDTASRLIKITDTGASSTATTLATAPTNYAFRGVDFAPTSTPEIVVESPVNTAIASGGTRALGNNTVGVTVNATFTVRNTGTADLVLSNIAVSGDADFTLASSNNATIGSGSSQNVTVNFTPASGSRAAILTLTNNDADENPYTINLIGTGVVGAVAPTVTTLAVSSVGTGNATLNGSISADGGAALTDRGFVFSDTVTTPTIGNGTQVQANPATLGNFSVTQSAGLVANTLYYQQAYATNNASLTGYGGVLTFTTLPNAPTIAAATSVSTTSFTANWSAPTGGNASYTYTLEFDDNNDFSSTVVSVNLASNTTSYQVTGLTGLTTYYYRIKAVNVTGSSDWSGTASATTTDNVVSLTALDGNYTESFDTLSNNGTSSVTPTGWFFSENGTGSPNNTYGAGNGSSNTANTYSLGADGSTERAFGGLQSGSLNPTVGTKLTNNTGVSVNALEVAYSAETWRVGNNTRSDGFIFQYTTGSPTSLIDGNVTWTTVPELNYTNNSSTAGSAPLSGSSAPIQTGNVTATITNLSLANGASIWFRWLDTNAADADDAIGIDDFRVTPRNLAAAPEIVLSDGVNTIPNGGTDPVGSVNVGSTATVPYDIFNTGTLALNLGNATITSTSNATATVNTQPESVVDAEIGITSLSIDVTPTAAGPWSVTVSLPNDDPDESTTSWTITGNGRSVASVSLNATNTPYSENFNTLANTANTTSSTLPSGWYFEESGSSANLLYTVGNGSSGTGDTYSLGINGDSDRALGSLQSGSLIPTIGAKFQNNTGTPITSLAIAYTGETWRFGSGNSSVSDQLSFQISTDATYIGDIAATWSDVSSLDYNNGGSAAATSGSLQHSGNVTHTITGLNIPGNATFFIRWVDVNAGSTSVTDDAMGIDDFSITANPSASSTPEITLSRNGTITNGGTDNVGTLSYGVASEVTTTLTNDGDADLVFSGNVTVTGSTNANATVTLQPAATVTAGNSTTTTVSITPTAAGAWSVTLSLPNNDSDENPATWTITGNAQSPFQTWKDGYSFGGGNSTAGGDPNNDGLTNLESYALGIDPVAASPTGARSRLAATVDTVTAGGPWFAITHRRLKSAAGVTINVRSFTTPGGSPTTLVHDGVNVVKEVANSDVDGDGLVELVRYRVLLNAATRRFFDVNVVAE